MIYCFDNEIFVVYCKLEWEFFDFKDEFVENCELLVVMCDNVELVFEVNINSVFDVVVVEVMGGLGVGFY